MKKPLQNPTSEASCERSKWIMTKSAAPRSKPLSAKAQAFAEEYLIDFNGARAARAVGYNAANARDQACDLLKDPRVQVQVAQHIAEHSAKAQATVEAVLDRLWAGATVDAREFSELHLEACRYCYGLDHRYQFTPGEMDAARRDWLASTDRDEAGSPFKDFDPLGGFGYSPKRDPHPDCPECFGYGVARVIIKDTRDLSPSAVKVYAGVKKTQHGMEIRQHDTVAMLLSMGKQLGMFAAYLARGDRTSRDADEAEGNGYVIIAPATANSVS